MTPPPICNDPKDRPLRGQTGGGVFLSAVVIALNEEKNLPACLESLKFADEIVVLDSGSHDRTVEIARRYTDKVFQRPFDDFSSQKNFAIAKAAGDWIVSIDADERVSEALAGEIRRATVSGKGLGYEIPRKTRLFGKVLHYCGLQSDRPLRLFKKDSGRFEGVVHERVFVRGSVGCLTQTLEHLSFQTLKDYMRRLQLYTSLEPQTSGGHEKATGFFLRPFHRFFSMYFWNQGFRDGIEGLIYCELSAFYEFVRRIKLWEKEKGKAI